MVTLIAVYNSSGCVGRCDARCYGAKHPNCDCICGGKNHGAGMEQAMDNTREMVEQWVEDYAQNNDIQLDLVEVLNKISTPEQISVPDTFEKVHRRYVTGKQYDALKLAMGEGLDVEYTSKRTINSLHKRGLLEDGKITELGMALMKSYTQSIGYNKEADTA